MSSSLYAPDINITNWGSFMATFAISERYLNKQLQTAFVLPESDDGKIPDTFKWEIKSTAINATLGAPSVALKFDNAQGTEVQMTVPITGGTLVYKQYNFDTEELETIRVPLVNNNYFRYTVNLDIGEAAAQNTLKPRQEILDQVNAWDNSMFNPLYLYMNFEDPSIIESFRMNINLPANSDPVAWNKTVQAIAAAVIKEKRDNNQFVFGAVCIAKDTNTDGAEDSFHFSGCTFATIRNSDNDYERSINYLFVNNGEPAPSNKEFLWDSNSYFTSKDTPASFYFHPNTFTRPMVGLLAQSLSSARISSIDYNSNTIKAKSGEMNITATVGIKKSSNIMTVNIDGEATESIIWGLEHVHYWLHNYNNVNFTLNGEKLESTNENVKKEEGNDGSGWSDFLRGLQGIGQVIGGSYAKLFTGDDNILIDGLKSLGAISGDFGGIKIAESSLSLQGIALPGKGELLVKDFGFNKFSLPSVRVTYSN